MAQGGPADRAITGLLVLMTVLVLWSVRDGDVVVGCGALKRLDPRHAEVKSMRTNPARQRAGSGEVT